FMITGPGSPSIVSNTVLSIEQHVDWIARCIGHLEEKGVATIEASAQAEAQWVRHVGDLADATLHPKGPSYMVGANVAGKPRVYMPYLGGVPRYRAECEQVAADGYRGFEMSASPEPARS